MDYEDLDDMIDRLDAYLHDSDPEKGYWAKLWTLVREIGSGFKSTRYATKEQMDASWQSFQRLCAGAKAKSEENRKQMESRQRDWKALKTTSERARSRIEGRAAGARPASGIEEAIGAMALLPLTIVEKVVGKLLGLREKSEFEEARDRLKSCGDHLKDAWQEFSRNKNDLLPADKAKCFQVLRSAQDKLDEAWPRLKNAQDAFYSARKEEWERKQAEWRDRQQQRESKQREWEQRQQAFRERVRANIERLDDKLDGARSALARQEAALRKLESDYSAAWSESFKEKCSGWIDETEDRIRDIRESITRIEGWIDEERNKLR